MTLFPSIRRARPKAFSLVLVLVTVGVAFLALTGALLYSSNWGQNSDRRQSLHASQAAAEAAIEKVISSMSRDFQASGVGGVEANLALYTALAPTTAESPAWDTYEFASPGGVPVSVTQTTNWGWGPINWKYTGINASNAVYRIVANARDRRYGTALVGAVRQDVQVAEIPLFSYLAFYQLDLEVGVRSGNWNWNGPVHGNADMYLYPDIVTLTAYHHVTACGEIRLASHPLNCYASASSGSVNFLREHDSGVSALRLSIGTAPTNLWAYYRSVADLAIEVDGTNWTDWVISIPKTGYTFSSEQATNFLRADRDFTDKRQNNFGEKTWAAEIDLDAFIVHATPYLIGGQMPRVLYIANREPDTAGRKHAVRIKNAQTLPAGGLTLATPNPLYVWGHFNVDPSQVGTTNTSLSRPACLAADAVTVLSATGGFGGGWDDQQSHEALSYREAWNTTINAAIITGIVPTSANGEACYSGGMENALRFVEDWSYMGGRRLNFNGSLAVLFPSALATEPWPEPGDDVGVFKPPVRVYRFDENFRDPSKLPPATPMLRALIRSEWRTLPPGATS